jgi:hypothetical protein
MHTILLVAFVVAVVFGIVAEAEAKGRSWAGWAIIVGFGALLYQALS